MKDKKKLCIIAGLTAVMLIITAILCAVLVPDRSRATDDNTSDSPNDTVGDMLLVENPSDSDVLNTIADIAPDDTDDTTPEIIPGETVEITPPEETDKNDGQTQPAEKPSTTEKAETAAQPVTSAQPKETESPAPESTGGITIGGTQPEPYSCGVAGHHCEGAETHAYITNLELEGCPYCGSHSCASFYAQDEWGNACYTPSKCPQYDIKKDPAEYCQDCGKKLGDGRNGTCVQFVVADNCPNCGEYVEAWTCHTCK